MQAVLLFDPPARKSPPICRFTSTQRAPFNFAQIFIPRSSLNEMNFYQYAPFYALTTSLRRQGSNLSPVIEPFAIAAICVITIQVVFLLHLAAYHYIYSTYGPWGSLSTHNHILFARH